jgi:hypothetical protein
VTSTVARRGGAEKAGQALVGGFIGAAMDASTGAGMDLAPNPAFVKLETETDLQADGQPQSLPASPRAPDD